MTDHQQNKTAPSSLAGDLLLTPGSSVLQRKKYFMRPRGCSLFYVVARPTALPSGRIRERRGVQRRIRGRNQLRICQPAIR